MNPQTFDDKTQAMNLFRYSMERLQEKIRINKSIQEEEIHGLEKIVEERDEQIKRLKKFMLKIMREKVQAEAENVRLKEEIEENECCKSVMWVQ